MTPSDQSASPQNSGLALDLPPSPAQTIRQSEAVLSLAYSPDGQLLSLGGAQGKISIYNARVQQLQKVLRGQSHQISALAWAPDSQTMGVSNGELWDRATWRMKQKLDVAPQNTKLPYTLFNDCVAWSPDGHLMA
ncbi:MAG: hypothetical protein EOP14_06085, partial [Pseudomonas sp.]